MKNAPDTSAVQAAAQALYDQGYADGEADQKAIDTAALQGVSPEQEAADIAAATSSLNDKVKALTEGLQAAHQLDTDLKGKLIGAVQGIVTDVKSILDAAIPDAPPAAEQPAAE
jgi:hypothetical protein